MSVWDELGLCYRLNFATNESLLGRDNLLRHVTKVKNFQNYQNVQILENQSNKSKQIIFL